jgi:hypothetical protein
MDEIFLLKKVGFKSDGILRAKNRKQKSLIRFEAAVMRSAIRGHQLKYYGKTELPNIYPFPFDTRGKPLSEDTLRKSFPLTYDYLLRHQQILSRRHRAKGCPWYSTFIRLPGSVNETERLMSPKITCGNRFRLIGDSMLVAHESVVVITPKKDLIDPYYLLGILSSKVFARYVSLTMPKINVGRFSLRLLPLRKFPLPKLTLGDNAEVSGRIAPMVQEWFDQSADQAQVPILPHSIEAEIDRLYNSMNS